MSQATDQSSTNVVSITSSRLYRPYAPPAPPLPKSPEAAIILAILAELRPGQRRKISKRLFLASAERPDDSALASAFHHVGRALR